MSKVRIDGFGVVDIPGPVTDAKVDEVVSDLKLKGLWPTPTKHKTQRLVKSVKEAGAKAVHPLWNRLPEIYSEEVQSGLEGMRGDSLMGKAGGLMQYLFSPLTAYGRAFAGEPTAQNIEAGMQKVGFSPETSATGGQFTGDVARYGAEFFNPYQYVKAVMGTAQQVPQLFKYLSRPTEKTPPAAPIAEGVSDTTRRVVEGVEEASTAARVADDAIPIDDVTKGFVPHLSDATQNDVIVRVGKAAKENFNNKRRLFREVGKELINALENNRMPIDDLWKTINHYGLSPVEFAEQYMKTVSESARSLQKLSQLAKQIAKHDPNLTNRQRVQLQELAERAAQDKDGNGFDLLMKGYRAVENGRRALLVTQIATAMRNFWSQAGRLTLGMVDDAMTAAIRGTTAKQSLKGAWDAVASHGQALASIKDRKLVNDILSGNPITESRLMNRSTHEVELAHKALKFVNGLNLLQERFFRKMAFEARLRQNLKQMDMDIRTVKPDEVPPEALADAVNYALEMTFAAEAKGKYAKKLVKGWNYVPGLTTVNPFPRFAFANALPFLVEHSPLGFARAMSPKALRELASGNPERFARAASRGFIGTGLLAGAMEMRKRNPNTNWYEMQTGFDEQTGESTTIDLRGYAPFSTYLLIAEAMMNPDKLAWKDFAQAAIGLNRIAGTGLVVVDWLRAKEPEMSKQSFFRWLGQYLGSATVGLRSARDIASAFDEEGSVYRDPKADTAAENIIHPTLANIPGLEKDLAEGRSSLREGPLKGNDLEIFGLTVPAGILRQFTGVTLKKRNKVQVEIDRLGVRPSVYRPRTGIKEADRVVSEIMAKVVTQKIPEIMESDTLLTNVYPFLTDTIPNKSYKELTDKQKIVAMEEMLKEIKGLAVQHVKDTRKDLEAMMAGKSESRSQAAMFEELTGINVRDPEQQRMRIQGRR